MVNSREAQKKRERKKGRRERMEERKKERKKERKRTRIKSVGGRWRVSPFSRVVRQERGRGGRGEGLMASFVRLAMPERQVRDKFRDAFMRLRRGLLSSAGREDISRRAPKNSRKRWHT
jgi:hypothetical protein